MRPLVWLRSDLRVRDNPALYNAARAATKGVVAVFLVCPKQWREHDWGDNRVDWVRRNLETCSADLADRGIGLLIRTVPTFDGAAAALREIAEDLGCDALYFNREHEVNEIARDEAVTAAFEADGREVRTSTDQCILAPGTVRTQAGDVYTVFTPFRKSWTKQVESEGLGAPLGLPKKQDRAVRRADDVPASIDGFDAAPQSVAERWPAGEDAARRRLRRFVDGDLADYDDARDRPDLDATSGLSPYLTVGAISPRACVHAAYEANGERLATGGAGAVTWISELIWREFYRHVLEGFPRVSRHRAFRRETERLEWREADEDFEAWCSGRTGVPIVDAAMRQLRTIGWMHNRLRMITAMFLTKDLFIDWRRGERHFMAHLVDGDLASNNGGWQWAASTGTDAVPYFRVFNPYRQSERFDPDGAFIRRYVPELEDVPGKAIHDPQRLDDETRAGLDYPEPIVDHAEGKDRAVAAFKALK